MIRFAVLLISHGAMLALGFALGVYFLPILTAPDSLETALLQEEAQNARYTAEFARDLRGSDFLHWGEGQVSVSANTIVHQGRLAPGPDYKVYLSTEFVEDEDEFLPIKDSSVLIGDVKTFDGFLLNLPEGVDIEKYNTVLVWCETFGQFISAAKYR